MEAVTTVSCRAPAPIPSDSVPAGWSASGARPRCPLVRPAIDEPQLWSRPAEGVDRSEPDEQVVVDAAAGADERAGDEVPPADADVFEHHRSAATGELDLDVRGGVGDQDSTTEAIADGSHPTVPSDQGLDSALDVMVSAGVAWVPVTDPGRHVVGIVAMNEVIAAYQSAFTPFAAPVADTRRSSLLVEGTIAGDVPFAGTTVAGPSETPKLGNTGSTMTRRQPLDRRHLTAHGGQRCRGGPACRDSCPAVAARLIPEGGETCRDGSGPRRAR
jgi:hypothetical protein